MTEAKLQASTRMRFMQGDNGTRRRIELFVMPTKFTVVQGKRVGTIQFSHKLDAETANLCDEKIRRAFEDCGYIEREIDSVTLGSEIENTHIEFFDLPESKPVKLRASNATIVGLYVERSRSQIYLYFQFQVQMAEHGAIGHFFVDRVGTAIFAEFEPSQFALTPAEVGSDPQQPLEGITSMTMQIGDEKPVALDMDKVRKAAKKGKS